MRINNNHTMRPVLAGIFLIVLVGGGIYLNTLYRNTKKPAVQQTAPVSVVDPYCTGSDHPKADLGYGIEHTYADFITPAMPITIVLSCNQDKLTITGSVNQVITSQDIIHGEGLDMANGMEKLNYSPSDFTLVDTSYGADGVINTATDYNFDGYNDLSVIIANGSGAEDDQIEYAIYLYDQITRQFVYNSDLSSLANIGVNTITKKVSSTHGCKFVTDSEGYDHLTDCKSDMFTWKDGKLVEVKK